MHEIKNAKIDGKNAKIGVLDSWEAAKNEWIGVAEMPINCRQTAGKLPITIKEANSTDKEIESTDKREESTDKKEMSTDKMNMSKETIIEYFYGYICFVNDDII